MTLKDVSAEVISRPGGLADVSYPALEIRLKGFESPYALTLALPAIVYKALSEQMDPMILYNAIASAVNRPRAISETARKAPREVKPSCETSRSMGRSSNLSRRP